MIFNPNKIRELEDVIDQAESDISKMYTLAKFHVKAGNEDWDRYMSEDIEKEYNSDKVAIETWEYHEDMKFMYHSDSLIDAIMCCVIHAKHVEYINDVNFKEYYFTFLIDHYETILNHPEHDKLIMLLESLQHENIELLKQLIGVEG